MAKFSRQNAEDKAYQLGSVIAPTLQSHVSRAYKAAKELRMTVYLCA